MVKFAHIHSDIVPVLKEAGITEQDLFLGGEGTPDLYVGCKDRAQATSILHNKPWKSMSGYFIPQKGSDMEQYPNAVDIWGGYIPQKFRKDECN